MAITIDGTTGIASVDGSAGSPSVRGSDSNSGIVYAADTVSISTGGTERLEVDSAGKIDIPDNGQLRFGTGNDFKFHHNGSGSYIENDTGVISSWSAGNHEFKSSNGNTRALLKNGGACELFYDNSKKFETASYGAKAQGNLTVQGAEGEIATLTLEADEGDDNADYWRIVSATNGNFGIQNYASASWENNVVCVGNGGVELYYDNVQKAATSSGGFDISGWVRPGLDDYWDCGHPSYRWDDIRATNSNIVTSDKNEKNTIVDTDLGLSFVNKLKPVSYKFNGKTRTHYGLIAQDVETVITDLGKTTTQFAPLIKDTLEDGTERYGLRYGEFISPLIKAVQELSAEVETLKTKVAALEAG